MIFFFPCVCVLDTFSSDSMGMQLIQILAVMALGIYLEINPPEQKHE